MRFDNSGRAIRQIDGLLDVVHPESSSSNNDDNPNDDQQQVDDENDNDEIDEEDIVNIRLPIVDSYGDKGHYEGSVLRSSLHEDLPIPTAFGTMKYADGRVYKGKVTGVKEFGAFVELVPGQEGLCHVSELTDGRADPELRTALGSIRNGGLDRLSATLAGAAP